MARRAILPSVLPAAPARDCSGFTDLSRYAEWDRSHSGQFHLPDKEFRSGAPYVAVRPGPYLRLDRVGREAVGVWPLRIPVASSYTADVLLTRQLLRTTGLSC